MRKLSLTKSTWFHMGISLALMLLFRFLPPFSGITPYGMTMLGIFLGTIYGWIFSDIMWPSFLCLIVLVLTTDVSPAGASALLSTVLQDNAIVSIIAVQFVASIVVLSGTVEWIGRWFLSRPVIKGRPILMIAFLFLAGILVTPFNTTAWLLLMYEFVDTINTNLGYERKSRFSQILLYCVMFNGLITLYLPTQAILIMPLGLIGKHIPGYSLDIYPMILFGLIMSVSLATFNFLALKTVFRLDLSGLKDERVSESIQPPPPMTKKQKVVSAMLIGYLVLLVLPYVLPAEFGLTVALKKLGLVGLSLVAVVLAIVIRVDGKPIATFQEISKSVNWSIVFMPGTAIVLAGALISESTGISKLLSDLTMPLFNGFSPYLFVLVILILAMILTNVINNIVVFSLFIPIIVTIAPTIGANVYAIMPLLISAVNMAIMFPSANPMAALLHANTRQMETKQIILFALVSIVVCSFVFAVIGIPLANLLY